MADSERPHSTVRELGVREEEHPVWTDAFSDPVRVEQLEDDLIAGRSVSGLLVAIVSTGLALAVLTVWLCS